MRSNIRHEVSADNGRNADELFKPNTGALTRSGPASRGVSSGGSGNADRF